MTGTAIWQVTEPDCQKRGHICHFFLFKRVLDQGPERRESKLTVLCPLIIIILNSYTIVYYIINYGEPSQPKRETELLTLLF